MKGIEAACEGTIIGDAEIRRAASGRDWLAFSVSVEMKPDRVERIDAAAFSGSRDLAQLATELKSGTEVYLQGKLSLRKWADSSGEMRATLFLAAAIIQPLGVIGHKRPKPVRTSKAVRKPDINRPLDVSFNDTLPF